MFVLFHSPEVVPKGALWLSYSFSESTERFLHRNSETWVKTNHLEQTIEVGCLLIVFQAQNRLRIFPYSSRASSIAIDVQSEDISLTFINGALGIVLTGI